jgi:hypothetical protein
MLVIIYFSAPTAIMADADRTQEVAGSSLLAARSSGALLFGIRLRSRREAIGGLCVPTGMATSATGRHFNRTPRRAAVRQILSRVPKFADIWTNGLSG